MKKVINPCTCKVYGRTGAERMVNAFAKIEFDGKRLSICGVIGPTSNGDCNGGAGQCVDGIRSGTPADGWTREMLDKFCDIWDRWHLNDMRPCCKHQRELGWESEAKEEITLYHYTMTREASEAKRKAEKAALSALRNGETFTPTKGQRFFANLPYDLDIYEAPPEELAPYFKPKKPLWSGDAGPTERKIRGWVRYDESELGILCKPCPVCGYKYGTAWKLEEVPQDVIDWLFALPDTKVTPAWC